MDELKKQEAASPVEEKKQLNANTVSDEKVVQENLEKYDSESRYRRPDGFWGMAIKVLCIAFSLFQFYTAGFGVLPAQIQRPSTSSSPSCSCSCSIPRAPRSRAKPCTGLTCCWQPAPVRP